MLKSKTVLNHYQQILYVYQLNFAGYDTSYDQQMYVVYIILREHLKDFQSIPKSRAEKWHHQTTLSSKNDAIFFLLKPEDNTNFICNKRFFQCNFTTRTLINSTLAAQRQIESSTAEIKRTLFLYWLCFRLLQSPSTFF